MNPPPEVSVVLPTYNEARNIADLVDAIGAALSGRPGGYETIVVDDDSPDGTAGVVRTRFGDRPEVCLIVRTDERGLASAVRRGIEASEGDVVAVMDTDFNHDPAMLPQMV